MLCNAHFERSGHGRAHCLQALQAFNNLCWFGKLIEFVSVEWVHQAAGHGQSCGWLQFQGLNIPKKKRRKNTFATGSFKAPAGLLGADFKAIPGVAQRLDSIFKRLRLKVRAVRGRWISQRQTKRFCLGSFPRWNDQLLPVQRGLQERRTHTQKHARCTHTHTLDRWIKVSMWTLQKAIAIMWRVERFPANWKSVN